MSYQVLARKWRPKSFETLVGQDHVVRALTNALEQNRLHHAYLFTGTRGVGKTTLARILAKSLNCETGITAKPCGVCNACVGIDDDRFIDYLEINAASTRGIDDVRSLLEQATYAPTLGRFKIFMLDEVHQLTKEAFNALLKTLEEPPSHVKFILGTTDPQKVPVTVLSRCLQFNLRQMAGTSIISHLQNILGQENIPYEPTALHLISRAAAGSMRDALSLTDQAIAYGGQTVNESEVRSMLGAIDQSYLYQLIDALLANDGAGIIAQAKSMEERSLSFEAALNDLAQLLHQIAVAQTVPDSVADDLPERTLLLGLAQRISPETLQLYYQIALLGRRDIGLAPDEFAGFTMSLLRMLAFTPSEGEAKKLPNKPLAQPNKAQADTLVKPQILSQPIEKPIDKPAEPVLQQSDSLQTDEMIENESNQSFNGNWRGLLDQLKLGLARNLALNSALLSYDENTMRFAIQDKDKALLSPMYQDKLSSALQQHFGRKIRLEFSVEGSANTPAKQVAQEKAHAQANAESSIEDDSFVQALINDFGASIIPNSIKPIKPI
ncbi:MAG: DNA polymerase III subunit gamma/tau [Methylotenera sp.]|uniref:DNA polymerase III subunit gamma/tau n=1 Tax=Methylotenera sp. TaxID=2051956 RepID=UPI00272FB9EC|nr:DNA polymerase III subunit gamma/tau [Methylotenera sp.]MDP2071368.1 DNA polymerase III subunit gamma/tau [Methylotenera sp.]